MGSSRAQSILARLQQLIERPASPILYLDLSNNRLTALPPELSQLRLVQLDVSDNLLTAVPPGTGPTPFTEL